MCVSVLESSRVSSTLYQSGVCDLCWGQPGCNFPFCTFVLRDRDAEVEKRWDQVLWVVDFPCRHIIYWACLLLTCCGARLIRK